MIGAIAGDIIGSRFEWNNTKTVDFPLFTKECRFTDDSVLTAAVADSILSGTDYAIKLKEYYRRFPAAGYGGSFRKWGQSEEFTPYNSWGNGSAMRVSPVGFAFDTLEEVMEQAKQSAAVTHNHPEGIKGAQTVAAAVFLARTGSAKSKIREFITQQFGYPLTESVREIRTWYTFDVSCQGSVPQAITAFLESKDYEDAVRLAISLGGDSDTIACITGGIAQAFYGNVPEIITSKAMELLDEDLRKVVTEFTRKFVNK